MRRHNGQNGMVTCLLLDTWQREEGQHWQKSIETINEPPPPPRFSDIYMSENLGGSLLVFMGFCQCLAFFPLLGVS